MIVNTLFSTLKLSLEFTQKTEFRINYSLNLFHCLLYNIIEIFYSKSKVINLFLLVTSFKIEESKLKLNLIFKI